MHFFQVYTEQSAASVTLPEKPTGNHGEVVASTTYHGWHWKLEDPHENGIQHRWVEDFLFWQFARLAFQAGLLCSNTTSNVQVSSFNVTLLEGVGG